MHLRIIGGQLRGKKLLSVPGDHTRPTANRVREAIFNILAWDIKGTQVLDLFAGTGILGLEALSRGAQSAVFVDNHPLPQSVIQKNIAACGFSRVTRLLRVDVATEFHWQPVTGNGFRLVFMDPPYNRGLVVPTLRRLNDSGMLSKEAIVTIEHSPLESINEEACHPFLLKDQRKYGKTLVSFLRYAI